MVTATKILKKRRRVVFILLLFLFSCRTSYPCWEIEPYQDFGSFYTAKVFLSSQSDADGVEVEVVRSPSGLRVYLNLKFCPVCPDNLENQTISVSYQIDEEYFSSNAYIFEGGQRLLLSEEAQNRIITALLLGVTVHIDVASYSTDIVSLNFPALYHKIMQEAY